MFVINPSCKGPVSAVPAPPSNIVCVEKDLNA